MCPAHWVLLSQGQSCVVFPWNTVFPGNPHGKASFRPYIPQASTDGKGWETSGALAPGPDSSMDDHGHV